MPIGFPDDSPVFRKHLQHSEDNIRSMHNFVDRLAAGSRRFVHYGHKFADSHVAYADNLLNSIGGDKDPELQECYDPALRKLGATLKDLHGLSEDMLTVTEQSIGRLQLNNEEEWRKIKEAKRRFAESDVEWVAAVRRAHSIRKESHDTVTADREFVDAKLAFEYTRFELVAALNEVEGSKQLELIEGVRASVASLAHFYEQGCARMRDLATHLDALLPAISEQQQAHRDERARVKATLAHLRILREEHRRGVRTPAAIVAPHSVTSASSDDEQATGPADGDSLLYKEGYLFKKSRKKAVSSKIPTGTSSWKRLWFKLEGGVLYYHKRAKGSGDDGIRTINLLICTVAVHEKETGKRFCFDLVSPYRSFTLQAESASSLASWVESLRASIEHNIFFLGRGNNASSGVVQYASDGSEDLNGPSTLVGPAAVDTVLAAISNAAGNHACADCGEAATRPEWACLPYGCLVCIECSGIHRSLGVHISKVRSLSLDTWSLELAKAVSALGNTAANRALLAMPIDDTPQPTAASSRADKEAWIRSKYVERRGLKYSLPSADLAGAICKAVGTMGPEMKRSSDEEEAGMAAVLALLVQANLRHGALDAPCEPDGYTPMHAAATADNPEALELLLLAGASIDAPAGPKRATPLHAAVSVGSERCVALLLRRGADRDLLDGDGLSALEIARRDEQERCEHLLFDEGRSLPDTASQVQSRPRDLTIDLHATRDGSVERPPRDGGTPGMGPWTGGQRPASARHSRSSSGGLSDMSALDALSRSLSATPRPRETKPSDLPSPDGVDVDDGGAPSSAGKTTPRRSIRVGPLHRKFFSLVRSSKSNHEPRAPDRATGVRADSSREASVEHGASEEDAGRAGRPPDAATQAGHPAVVHRRSRTWGGPQDRILDARLDEF